MRSNLLPQKKPPTTPERCVEFFRQWLQKQIAMKRSGERAFIVTVNSQGEITGVEGQAPFERYA
jgi:hypothetical protein